MSILAHAISLKQDTTTENTGSSCFVLCSLSSCFTCIMARYKFRIIIIIIIIIIVSEMMKALLYTYKMDVKRKMHFIFCY